MANYDAPSTLKKHLDCLCGSRETLNTDFKLYRGRGTFTEIYKGTDRSYVMYFVSIFLFIFFQEKSLFAKFVNELSDGEEMTLSTTLR